MKFFIKVVIGCFLFSANTAAAIYDVTEGAFTVYDPLGVLAAPADENVIGVYDDVTGVMSLSSTSTFFGLEWSGDANVITVPSTYLGVDINVGQWLGHFLFDYGLNQDIDVLNLWDVSIDGPSGVISLLSVDGDNDGIAGIPTWNGATVGFNYNFDLTLTPQPVPVPAAALLFVSGLLLLTGFTRKSKLVLSRV